MYIIDLLVEHPVQSLDVTWSYLYDRQLEKGMRVRVSFNHQSLIGYVMGSRYTSMSEAEIEETFGYPFKWIQEVIDEKSVLNEELMDLAEKMARLTLSPRIACYQAMLPPTLKPASVRIVKKKTQKAVRIIKEGTPVTKVQKQLYEELQKKGPQLIKDLPYSASPIKGLLQQGLIEVYDQEIQRDPYLEDYQEHHVTLTSEQNAVVQAIEESDDCISLLHGVTGSGKTEVYLALSDHVLAKGRNVIMLVPEISLTPMIVKRFKDRFHEDVAVLHSRLSDGEKYDEYRRIQDGRVRIVVGARSAIFAPLRDIGLIVLDEEHDASYKQDRSPRYATLTIAKLRAESHQAKIVLGSATPLMESYARALKGSYHLYELKHRINKQPLPNVEIVDMGQQSRKGHYGLMSEPFLKELQNCLNRGEQAIILLNKRGYASFMQCSSCRTIIKCPHCDVSLTYHKSEQLLKCHACGYISNIPHECPNCHGTQLKKIGYGTQRIEEELALHCDARIIRFDYDTTRHKNTHTKLLKQFEDHEADILLGTQMIAKGLDFPNVTFVGVLMADLSLTIPDYRANERTFELLTQVAGRCGRGERQGKVIIQTYNPDHYAIQAAARQDYAMFYEQEIQYRQLAQYPPFCHLVSVVIQSSSEDLVLKSARQIKAYLQKELSEVRIIGPGPANIYRMKDIYRQKILIKYIDGKHLHQTLYNIIHYYDKEKGRITVYCDFNPS